MGRIVVASAVAVLAVAMSLAASAGASSHDARFSDVPPDHAHYAAVQWAYHSGITNGCGDGTDFCPDDLVSVWEKQAFRERYAEAFPDCPALPSRTTVGAPSRAQLVQRIHSQHIGPFFCSTVPVADTGPAQNAIDGGSGSDHSDGGGVSPVDPTPEPSLCPAGLSITQASLWEQGVTLQDGTVTYIDRIEVMCSSDAPGRAWCHPSRSDLYWDKGVTPVRMC